MKKKENSANRLKTYLSDGIQEAVSTKKKRKIRKSAQILPFGCIEEAVFTKKKKIGLNSPFGWYPRSRFYEKERKFCKSAQNSPKKKRKSAQNSPFGWYPRSRFYEKERKFCKSAQNLPFGWNPRSRF